MLLEATPSRMLCSRHVAHDVIYATPTNFFQELLVNVEQLTQQRDVAKNELDMTRDTAKTYYQKMMQAEAETSHLKKSMVAI